MTIVHADQTHHRSSFARQVVSSKRTSPSHSFGAPRGRIASDVRCKDICQHPTHDNPGPTYGGRQEFASSNVVRDFGSDRRFLEDGRLITAGGCLIKHSTEASPFSSTFPYKELGASKAEGSSGAPETANVSTMSTSSTSKAVPKRSALTQPDLNCLLIKYKAVSCYSFGSSGVGGRFAAGTQFSKDPACAVTKARVDFRSLRDKMPMPRAPLAPSALQEEEEGEGNQQ